MQPELTPEQYAIERAICDTAEAYRARVAAGRNWLSAEEAAHPDYAACNNDMRGRVEQFELLRDLPERFVAYLGTPKGNGMGCARQIGQSYPVTVWTGLAIGNATRGATWRTPRSYVSSTLSQYYATIGGREYTGRGQGAGMVIALKETAASKRKRQAKESRNV